MVCIGTLPTAGSRGERRTGAFGNLQRNHYRFLEVPVCTVRTKRGLYYHSEITNVRNSDAQKEMRGHVAPREFMSDPPDSFSSQNFYGQPSRHHSPRRSLDTYEMRVVTNATANPPCTQATGPGRAIHSRRRFLSALVPVGLTLAMGIDPMVASASPLKSDKLVHRMAEIDPSLAPDTASYDPTDERLRRAGRLIQQALNASTIEEEERTWTQIIDEYADVDALWRDDVLGRAYGNRGNCRSRQGKVEAALRDYDESIRICPWSVDPVLNRGVLFESQKMYEQAEADYRAVLKVSVDDPVAWNNLGNAQMGAEKFEEAIKALDKAVKLGGNNYAFAMANKAICLYVNVSRPSAEVGSSQTLLTRIRTAFFNRQVCNG